MEDRVTPVYHQVACAMRTKGRLSKPIVRPPHATKSFPFKVLHFMDRRRFLSLAVAGAMGMSLLRKTGAADSGEHFELELSDEQWRAKLSKAQYDVLRGHGTERSGSSPLDHEKRQGTFLCAG